MEIINILEQIRAFYNSPDRVKKLEDYTLAAVYGDQPIFKMLFRL